MPFYLEGHNTICELGDFFIKDNSTVYEIGCSTGTLSLKLSKHNNNKKNAKFIGVDIEKDMIDYANNNLIKTKITNIYFECGDIVNIKLKKSDFIVCYYTVQFIPTAVRQKVIDKIYQALNWGGAFIMFEKVRAQDARFQDIITSLYTNYKLQKGYSADEIIAKSMSLKGVLEPFSTKGNIDMLKRSGFVDIITVQKYLSFEGFLAIK